MQNAILLVSFGTSNYKTFKKTLNKLIKKVENKLAIKHFPKDKKDKPLDK